MRAMQGREILPRTVKLYRIESDGRRLAAGANWQLFLATARQGLYVASYRGVQLGTALVTGAGELVLVET
jgi:hypothetical protein